MFVCVQSYKLAVFVNLQKSFARPQRNVPNKVYTQQEAATVQNVGPY